MAIRKTTILCVFLLVGLVGCSPIQHISKTDVEYQTVQSEDSQAGDDEINAIIAPYKEQIDDEMNQVIGTVARDLTKRKPECTLGNWYTDGMMAGALKEDPETDFAIANYGGLRVSYLSKGPLTKGKLFELSPFDNLLVIVQVPGVILDHLMAHLAETGGWPVSKELKMTINSGELVEYTINGQPASSSKTYKIAMPDYIANGGDGFKELIPLERTQSGKLVRDILMDYARALTANGDKIDGKIEGRVVNLNN